MGKGPHYGAPFLQDWGTRQPGSGGEGRHLEGVPMMTTMEDSYILKFRLSDLGRSALKKEERQELCEEIYAKLTSVIDEHEVHGLQLYPQKWPKTVILSFKNESVKNKIYMEGLDIFNRHIELQDCSESAVVKSLCMMHRWEWLMRNSVKFSVVTVTSSKLKRKCINSMAESLHGPWAIDLSIWL